VNGAGFRLEPVTDRAWLAAFIGKRWGEPGVVSRGKLHGAEELSANRVMEEGAVSGVASWHQEQDAMELMTIDSLHPGRGVGTALMNGVIGRAREAGATRLWLITTNDNVDALRFYQRRGWCLSAVYVRAVEESRRLKPSIPLTGAYGIPIRDEIELEFPL
jgi:GNAT superfamily N-acetyltransferase